MTVKKVWNDKGKNLFAGFLFRKNVHSAFDTLFHHRASRFVRFVDVAVEMIVVGVATARTNEFRETVAAFFTGEQTRILEFFTKFGTGDAVEYATHFELLVARELVARI